MGTTYARIYFAKTGAGTGARRRYTMFWAKKSIFSLEYGSTGLGRSAHGLQAVNITCARMYFAAGTGARRRYTMFRENVSFSAIFSI